MRPVKVVDARSAALAALEETDNGRHLELAVRHAVNALGDTRDRALATEIAYGVQRWRSRLDAELAPRLKGKTDARVRQVLRIGLYQLRFLDRVPARAAVHAAVEQVRKGGLPHAAGMVNAVLRAVQREGEPAWPMGKDAPALALRYAHPEWLVRRWLEDLGEEATEAMLAANQLPPEHALRIRRGSHDSAREALEERGARVEPCRFAEQCLLAYGGGDSQQWPGILSGDWVLQDEAAQVMAALLPPADEHLDLCAAPGGKSFVLADRNSDARVFAVDASARRLNDMQSLRNRLGLAERVPLVEADAAQPVLNGRTFPSVLVDAPCSSLGTLRRNPDRKWREPPDPTLPDLQLRILRQAARQTAHGGHLLYVTCTLWRPENEEVALAFEAEHPGFERVSSDGHPFLTPEGFYQSRPDVHGTDAFFAAMWKRAG